MSTSTPPPKKPPSSGTGSTPSTARKAPAASTTTTSGTGTNSSSINRTRSVRNGAAAGTPVSARAAARKPDSTTSEEDLRAEMQSKLDELQQKLVDSEHALSSTQKQTEVLQIKLDEALKEQSILEDNVHEHTERIEELENEKREALRGRREMEVIFESERAGMLREREERDAREEEMQRSLVRLKESLSHQRHGGGLGVEDEVMENSRRHSRPLSISRTSSFRSGNASPNPETAGAAMGRDGGRQFAPASSTSLQRSDSRSSSQLVNQKDKIIEGLKLELAEAQIKLVELENKGGANLHLLERDMYEIKMLNARLMEENESFQLLLREKTLNGDFGVGQNEPGLLRAPSEAGGDGSRPGSRYPNANAGTSLADELDGQADEGTPDGEPDSAGAPMDSKERRLQSEVNSMKDQNKALTLYINNIISRLLQHEQFEQILDKTPDLMAGPGALSRKFAASAGIVDMDKELPPPPPPKDEKVLEDGQGQSLLQRAGSVLRGRPAKPSRPMSQMLAPEQAPKVDDAPTVHENPDTAPRIPLGRSGSTRNPSGAAAHRRTGSDWPAASVVTNMYKGPSPGISGPTSPGLGSPTGAGRSGSFFPLGAGARVPSGNSVPTIDELGGGKENHIARPPPPPPHRDSKLPTQDAAAAGSRSNRNSLSSNRSSDPTLFADQTALSSLTGEVSSNPSSPPRSTTSSGDRDNRAAAAGGGGAIMMGSKPRPLRLVQESAAQDEKKAGSNLNRGSWFGWMNKGAVSAAAGGLIPGRSVSGGSGDMGQQQ